MITRATTSAKKGELPQPPLLPCDCAGGCEHVWGLMSTWEVVQPSAIAMALVRVVKRSWVLLPSTALVRIGGKMHHVTAHPTYKHIAIVSCTRRTYRTVNIAYYADTEVTCKRCTKMGK